MSTTTISGIALFCAALVLAGLLAGCLGGQETPQRLSDVEVRDYHGQPLSSVNDFRENSIKGP
jgi:hypothetical protein